MHDEGDHSPTPSTPAHQTLQPSPASPADKGDTVSGPEAQSLPPSQGRNFFRDGTLSEETKSAIIRQYLAEWTAAGYIAATDSTPPPPPAVVARSNSPDEARDQALTSGDASFIADDLSMRDIPEGSSGCSDDSTASEGSSDDNVSERKGVFPSKATATAAAVSQAQASSQRALQASMPPRPTRARLLLHLKGLNLLAH